MQSHPLVSIDSNFLREMYQYSSSTNDMEAYDLALSPRAALEAKSMRMAVDDFKLLRTVTRSAEGEMWILANRRDDMNVLTTPSTAIFPQGGTRYSTISSVQVPAATREKWGGCPNLVFSPTVKNTSDRLGTSLVLEWPASLHTFRTGDLIDVSDAENKATQRNLHDRFLEFGRFSEENWEQDVVRNGVNKGCFGKYTEFALHANMQGSQLYQKGAELIEQIKHAIPERGAALRELVVSSSKINILPEQQRLIFESQKKYTQFLVSTNKNSESPKIVKACQKFENYLEKDPQGQKSYFEVIGEKLHAEMQAELVSHYAFFANEGLRHNEFIGRLFPWEVEGIEIGHIQHPENKEEVVLKFKNAKFFANQFQMVRQNMLVEFDILGIEHPLMTEFMDAKNAVLQEKGQDPLTTAEQESIFSKIKKKMAQSLVTYSYQNGHFIKADLPQDLKLSSNAVVNTLNTFNYLSISNRLRRAALLPDISYPTETRLTESQSLTNIARNAVRAILESNFDFRLTSSREDSGGLMLDLLKKDFMQSHHLTDSDLELKESHDQFLKNIKDNINLLSLDTCLSIISSPCYKNDAIKAKYENNAPFSSQESERLASALVDYSSEIHFNYADKHYSLSKTRPLCDYSVNGYTLPFHDMQSETQENLIQAWSLRKREPFNERLRAFFKKIKEKYALDLSKEIEKPSMQIVWSDVQTLERRALGPDHKNEITKSFFNALGGSWSREETIQDELNTFRSLYPQQDWLQNPFGDQYRQHVTGRGALTPIAPSEAAIQLAEKEIHKGLRPFENLEDMLSILSKLTPKDRFGLQAIFMNKPICAAPSGTALRIMNLWEQVSRQSFSFSIPSMKEMEDLCIAYLAGEKSHHTQIEIGMSIDHRRFPVDDA